MVAGIFTGLLCGILAGFGIGGGSLLMLYLTFFAGFSQPAAAAINLLFFLSCAPAALISHTKNRLIDLQAVAWAVPAGCITAAIAAYLASITEVSLLRRGFGLLLLIVGCRELFHKKDTNG